MSPLQFQTDISDALHAQQNNQEMATGLQVSHVFGLLLVIRDCFMPPNEKHVIDAGSKAGPISEPE